MSADIGIVGLASFYGPAYAECAAREGDVSVTAVVQGEATNDQLARLSRPTAAAFASDYDCTIYDSVAELLDDASVDAVVVASRTTRRADDAIRALQSKRPVLTGKPAAAHASDARRLAKVASDANLPTVTTSPARFDDAVQGLSERVERGEIGNVLRATASIRHDRVPEAGIEANAEHAPGEAGSAYAMAFYTADALLWLIESEPKRVYAEYSNRNTPYSSHPDLGVATVQFENGSIGSMTMTYSTDCRDPLGNWEFEVVGSDGMIRTRQEGYEGIHWQGESANRVPMLFKRTQSPVLERQFTAFVDAVRENGEFDAVPPSPHHTAKALALCEAWERSAERKKPEIFDY
ncbi:Gfo/Idh/MocA family protein [Haladaptatus salinisoli]|uniref:Gfo/Idh/MocA family protein n=1 Tax=Haladaptatus salinisoli TaxID=2884876 RepID=UPI001D09FAB7|nr:Gfo/Idh/MocA family oxidoreductase [Haladaptatus salinisoli]